MRHRRQRDDDHRRPREEPRLQRRLLRLEAVAAGARPARDIKSIDDLAGKKVGVQQGTTGKSYTEENATGADIVSFPSDAEMYQAIKAGQVDALLQDLPVNLEHTKDGGFADRRRQYDTDEQYGLAMKKGNTALVRRRQRRS